MLTYTSVITGAYAIVGLAGLLNILVILVVLRSKWVKGNPTGTYIMHLSIADLLHILIIPLLITTFQTKTWIFGDIACRGLLLLETANKYASVAFLLSLSWDRFLAVCYPISGLRFRTRKYVFATVLISWACVMTLLIPQFRYGRSQFIASANRTVCAMFWPGNATRISHKTSAEHHFILITFTIVFVLPTFLICIFYGFCLARLRQSSRVKSASSRPSDISYSRVTKMILAAIVIHTVCWGPYWCFSLINSVTFVPMSRWQKRLYNFILMLPHINSAVNPVLYGVLNRNYRGEFRSIFTYRTGVSVSSTTLSSTIRMSSTMELCQILTPIPATTE